MTQDQNLPNSGFSIDITVSRDNEILPVSKREMNIQMVRKNYEYWNRSSNFMSSNNYDDGDFKRIVAMGEDAVPGIFEIINDHPDPIVHALDLIYPEYMSYEGYVSLEDVCNIWIITLLSLGKV